MLRMGALALVLTLGLCALPATLADTSEHPAKAVGNKLLLERSAHLQQLAKVAEDPVTHFRQWARRHSRPYLLQNDDAELQRRFQIWSENLVFALDYNSKHETHWLGMTALADLTDDEFRQRYLGFDGDAHKRLQEATRASNALPKPFRYAAVDGGALPKAVDWRKKHAVSKVKDQGDCGSCWAFSATGAIEGINAIVTKKLVSLSEQELVDCDRGKQDNGCFGGLMDNAFQYVIKNKGLDSDARYPYKAEEGKCKKKQLGPPVVTIDGFEDVPKNDEASLIKAVAHQPVSVALALQESFQLYEGGVISDDEMCGTRLNHGVLVVGYAFNTSDGSYYIVKNSWGAGWGEDGYFRLKANVKAKEGLCGIAMVASYPTKTTPNPPRLRTELPYSP